MAPTLPSVVPASTASVHRNARRRVHPGRAALTLLTLAAWLLLARDAGGAADASTWLVVPTSMLVPFALPAVAVLVWLLSHALQRPPRELEELLA